MINGGPEPVKVYPVLQSKYALSVTDIKLNIYDFANIKNSFDKKHFVH